MLWPVSWGGMGEVQQRCSQVRRLGTDAEKQEAWEVSGIIATVTEGRKEESKV